MRAKIAIIFSVMMLTIVPFSIIAKAYDAAEEKESYKYYTYYTVQYGDTLESIAKEYYDEEHYTVKSYIREVAGINTIDANSRLRTGTVIAIPYYSDEYIY